MRLFGGKKSDTPRLSRTESLQARPVLNRLVRVEHNEEGRAVLHVPRRRTAMVRLVSKVFGMEPYRQIVLDELGTFVIERCDGEHTVQQIVDKLAERFTLTDRESEASTLEFVRTLARRSIVALAIGRETD